MIDQTDAHQDLDELFVCNRDRGTHRCQHMIDANTCPSLGNQTYECLSRREQEYRDALTDVHGRLIAV